MVIRAVKKPLTVLSAGLAKTEKVVQVQCARGRRGRSRALVSLGCTVSCPTLASVTAASAGPVDPQDVSYQFKLFNEDLRELDEALARLSYDILPQHTIKASATSPSSPARA